MLFILLLGAAFLLFVLSALGVGGDRFNLLAAGAACAVLVPLIQRLN